MRPHAQILTSRLATSFLCVGATIHYSIHITNHDAKECACVPLFGYTIYLQAVLLSIIKMLLRRDGGNSLAIDILAALCLSLLLCLVLVVCASPEPPSAPPEVCPLCNQSHCPPLDCNESLQYTDECECCTRCAKLEGERCGGRGDVGGRRCNGTDLYCATRVGRIFGEERLGVCERSKLDRLQTAVRTEPDPERAAILLQWYTTCLLVVVVCTQLERFRACVFIANYPYLPVL